MAHDKTYLMELYNEVSQKSEKLNPKNPRQPDKPAKRSPLKKKKSPLKKFTCNECGAVFGHKSSFQIHIHGVHLNIKPHKCNLCKKSFAIQDSLKTHKKLVHQKSKQTFKEPVETDDQNCDFSFSRKDKLKNHINVIHPNLKTYKCPKCSEAFHFDFELKIHDLANH